MISIWIPRRAISLHLTDHGWREGRMAKITLSKLRHSYLPHPKSPSDYALKEIELDWTDGGAYALLGPSGCGKSTLLNIISGLLHPSEGQRAL